jgi:hypothetical protein
MLRSLLGWRQGDTLHGMRRLHDHRCGMASQRHLSRLGTRWRRLMFDVSRPQWQAIVGGSTEVLVDTYGI